MLRTISKLSIFILLAFLSCKNQDINFGKEYNHYRKSLDAPLIKENMILINSDETMEYWEVPNFDKYSGGIHVSKSISIINIEQKNWHETDRYRHYLNDSIFEQILIHPYFIHDTIYWDSPKPIYFQMDKRMNEKTTKESDNKIYQEKHERTLRHINLVTVDSILNTWNISR